MELKDIEEVLNKALKDIEDTSNNVKTILVGLFGNDKYGIDGIKQKVDNVIKVQENHSDRILDLEQKKEIFDFKKNFLGLILSGIGGGVISLGGYLATKTAFFKAIVFLLFK